MWMRWSGNSRPEKSTFIWRAGTGGTGRVRNAEPGASFTTISPSGGGDTWMLANIAGSRAPSRRAANVPGTECAW